MGGKQEECEWGCRMRRDASWEVGSDGSKPGGVCVY